MELKIKGAVVTSAGNVRSNNEDNYYLFGNYRYDTNVSSMKEEKESLAVQALAAVYDGMGGEESGELASLTAARSFMPCKWDKVQTEALRQVDCANGELCREIRKRDGRRVGTTAVALYIDEGKAVCCNVGDSRCYFMRGGELRQLSMDHSEAENMIRMGLLDAAKARQSKSWHRLTQHLGIFPDEFILEPHFSETISLQKDDVFLLCSDGLTDMVMDDEIVKILSGERDAESAAEKLVEAALGHGGKDNVTAMVLRVCETEGGLTDSAKKLMAVVVVALLIAAVAAGIFVMKSPKVPDEQETTEITETTETMETAESTETAGTVETTETMESTEIAGTVETTETMESTETAGTVETTETMESTETAGTVETTETIEITKTAGTMDTTETTETAGTIETSSEP